MNINEDASKVAGGKVWIPRRAFIQPHLTRRTMAIMFAIVWTVFFGLAWLIIQHLLLRDFIILDGHGGATITRVNLDAAFIVSLSIVLTLFAVRVFIRKSGMYAIFKVASCLVASLFILAVVSDVYPLVGLAKNEDQTEQALVFPQSGEHIRTFNDKTYIVNKSEPTYSSLGFLRRAKVSYAEIDSKEIEGEFTTVEGSVYKYDGKLIQLEGDKIVQIGISNG